MSDDDPPKLYENVRTGHWSSVYNLVIGACRAKLEKDHEEGLEGAIRFDGGLYILIDPDN